VGHIKVLGGLHVARRPDVIEPVIEDTIYVLGDLAICVNIVHLFDVDSPFQHYQPCPIGVRVIPR
jgi:hypothetical protein